MAEVDINLSEQSKKKLAEPQQAWTHHEQEGLWIAYFAGHPMTASNMPGGESELYQLHYLGLIASGFEDVETAMASGASFAREVFQYLEQMIRE